MKLLGKIICLASTAIVCSGLAYGNVWCLQDKNSDMITTFFNGTGQDFSSSQFTDASAKSDALCQKIAEEGIALLKNQKQSDGNSALPLTTKKINVLGWHATDAGFLLSGIGSGSSTIQDSKKVSLLQALTDGGFEYNEDFIDMYKAYDSTSRGYKTGDSSRIPLVEPSVNSTNYTEDMMDDAKDFSDTAMIVISRIGGENVGEIPTKQVKSHGQATDYSRNYLELSTEEEALITLAEDNFSKVIVIVNSTNQLQAPRLKTDPDIDAVMNVGIMGQSGAAAIPKILAGEINPSGRLTDTWGNDYTKDPSYANHLKTGDNILYGEDIYFGYRWYETADDEGYFDNSAYTDDYEDYTGYDAEVTYPFGYGLSYTSFEWKVDSVSLPDKSQLSEDSTITFDLSVTNTGTVSGADSIQLYYSAPYTEGGIEKSSVNLVDFAKSVTIEPGKTQTGIKVEYSAYDMASYDCYDMNGNNFSGYELDPGTYTLSFRENSHTLKTMSDDKNTYTYQLKDDIQFSKDPTTGNKVENRMTGSAAYAGVSLDGRDVFASTKYLSRRDFNSTFPTALNTSGMNSANLTKANNYISTADSQTDMPTLNASNDLYLYTKSDGSKASYSELNSGNGIVANDSLIQAIGSNYDSSKLNELVDQLSAADCANVVENAGFKTVALASIGKPTCYDYDGPAGFNTTTQSDKAGQWTAFPNETLIAQTFSKQIAKEMGMAVALEGNATGLSGWYAPGVNLHRTPFNGRNYEYYSEDPIISGYMAANVIEGAKSYNLYAYIKHFCLSEPGVNARNLNTWLTEQNYREMYLKPFEIAVKKGGANAIMSAFNSVGGVWAGANYAQNVSILRNEWGFRGSMITDWSTGDGNMNTTTGLPGGNDIWLNPSTHASPISQSDPTMVYLAKQAVKNVVYTFCNTYTYAKNYDHSSDSQKVTIGVFTTKDQGFPWWKVLLGGVDAIFVGGFVTLDIFAFKPKRKKID